MLRRYDDMHHQTNSNRKTDRALFSFLGCFLLLLLFVIVPKNQILLCRETRLCTPRFLSHDDERARLRDTEE